MNALELLKEHNKRQYEVSRKSEYWASQVSGNKYPYYSRTTNLHRGVDRYSNIESKISDNGEMVYPLPKNEYPFTIEYSKTPYDK